MPLVLSASGHTRAGLGHPSFKVGDSSAIVLHARSANSAGATAWACGAEWSGGSVMGLGFSATNLLTLSMDDAGAGVSAPTLTGTTTDGWAAYGFSKATGTVAPRFHKYIYATGTASHETSGSTLADGIAMGVGHVSIGRRYSGNATLAFGSYLVVALYARPLTDAEFEAAVISLSSLINSNPNRGLWVYDKPVTTAGFAEMMIGSGSSFGTPGAADASGPIGYGHSIF